MPEEIRALLEENRRLRKEARLLHERVAAFERSRWWRAHPRFLFRASGRQSGEEPETTTAVPATDPAPDHTTAARFHDEVVSKGAFSRDAFTHAIAGLEPIVSTLAGRDSRILEIGSFEGLSACFFLWRLPRAHLTCVDTFRGSLGTDPATYGPQLEATFDRNTALVGSSRVRKIVGDSRRVLVELLGEGAEFDFAYVDGSHFGLDVIVDAALSWRLVRDGGTIVFDDYAYNDRGDDPLLRPGPAIDAFLALLDGKHEVLAKGAQLAVRKR